MAYDVGMLKRDQTDPLERSRLSGIATGLRKPLNSKSFVTLAIGSCRLNTFPKLLYSG